MEQFARGVVHRRVGGARRPSPLSAAGLPRGPARREQRRRLGGECPRNGHPGILCILDDSQLAHYDGLGLVGGGLLGYYRSLGFAVRHVTADDHKRPPLSCAELDEVWRAFQQLSQPVLVHCSAGRDRTGAALQHILGRLASGE